MYSEEFMMYLASYQKEEKEPRKKPKRRLVAAFFKLLHLKWIKSF